MIYCWKIFHGKCDISPTDLFSVPPHGGTRGHRFKVNHVRSQIDIRKRAFVPRCVCQWNNLPDHVVAEECLNMFKTLIAEALGDKMYDYHD